MCVRGASTRGAAIPLAWKAGPVRGEEGSKPSPAASAVYFRPVGTLTVAFQSLRFSSAVVGSRRLLTTCSCPTTAESLHLSSWSATGAAVGVVSVAAGRRAGGRVFGGG